MKSLYFFLALTLMVLKVEGQSKQTGGKFIDTVPNCTMTDLTSLSSYMNGLFMRKVDMDLGTDDILVCKGPNKKGTQECVFAPDGDINLLTKTDDDCCCPTVWGWWVLFTLRGERVMQFPQWDMYQATYTGRCLNEDCLNAAGKCRQAFRVGTYILQTARGWSVGRRSVRSHCRCKCFRGETKPNPEPI